MCVYISHTTNYYIIIGSEICYILELNVINCSVGNYSHAIFVEYLS